MIDWLNEEEDLDLKKYSLIDPTLNNAWFSGFVDADGGFYIRTTLVKNSNKKERISARFTIDQRMVGFEGESYGPILNLIANSFNCKLNKVVKSQGTYYQLVANDLNALNSIKEYLENYPLLTSKHLDYIC